MKIRFKIAGLTLAGARSDLTRKHPFAHERVGFLSAGLVASGDTLIILGREYFSVPDDQYLRDPSVGAMLGPDAIRRALQLALSNRAAMFHVHTHFGSGVPRFSGTDIREAEKFVPDFVKVAPQLAHGIVVLSNDMAAGRVWLSQSGPHEFISEFVDVGVPGKKWRAA